MACPHNKNKQVYQNNLTGNSSEQEEKGKTKEKIDRKYQGMDWEIFLLNHPKSISWPP